MIHRVFLFVAVAAFAVSGAGAADAAYDPAQYRALNEQIVQQHILPRYAMFDRAAAQFAKVAEEACDMPSTDAMETMRKAALVAQDAWQAVQHIRFGPVEQEMRSTRLAFWPDVRDRVSRELDEMLSKRDRSALTPSKFPDVNIVVQGFPAVERLLFEKDAVRSLIDGTVDAHYRCALVQAIAANIASIAAAVHKEWSEGNDSYAKTMAQAGGELALYQRAEEATLDLFKSLHGAVEIVADHKLPRPMGGSIDGAYPTRAEAWRSGRSMANIRRNLEAAQAMYLGENGDGKTGFSYFVREIAKDAELDDLLHRAFAQTLATANSVKMPLAEAVADPQEREKLEILRVQAAALKSILAKGLTAALVIPLGFNALDGD
jgi:uncharacterized protein